MVLVHVGSAVKDFSDAIGVYVDHVKVIHVGVVRSIWWWSWEISARIGNGRNDCGIHGEMILRLD